MIKSIIFSSIFHILIILIIIFSMGNPDRKQPAKTKEIKVNIIEQKIKKKRVRKVTSKSKKTRAKSKVKKKPKPKTKPKKIKKKEIKKQIPKKTIINKVKKKKEPPKKELKEIKKATKKIEKPQKLIHDIKEYQGVDDFGISGREKANLKIQITRCYQESKKNFQKLNLDVSINIRVARNGVIDYKNMIFTNQIELSKIDPKILKKITISIAKTLQDCSPLRNLPKDKYDIWKNMNIKFKY